VPSKLKGRKKRKNITKALAKKKPKRLLFGKSPLENKHNCAQLISISKSVRFF
jgi:hypothetical protein